MHSLSISPKQQPCRVIEQYSDTGITQLVAKTVLVTVVHPLAHPEDRHGGRVLRIICEQSMYRNINSCVHMNIHVTLSPAFADSATFYCIHVYGRTSFNCENRIASFSRVCKLTTLLAHPYVQFAQTQLINSQYSGTSEIRTPRDLAKVYLFRRCP